MVLRPDQFTEPAQEVLHNSQDLVRRYGHSQWDVEHILLALLQLEKGTPGDILVQIGVSVDAMTAQLDRSLEAAPKVADNATQIYATPRASRLLEDAKTEAERLKDDFIGAVTIRLDDLPSPRTRRFWQLDSGGLLLLH